MRHNTTIDPFQDKRGIWCFPAAAVFLEELMMDLKSEALSYHEEPFPGKVSVVPLKPCQTQHDLSLAYTPGVAQPVLEIEKDPENAYRYTSKSNLVAVITNGTSIMGLGDKGALASKPVMEGKGVMFKRFADVDVFDIEVNSRDPRKIIELVKLIEPTFGGINLEDIKAPECFEIEEELKRICDIPVFHDDQHGTAIISGAGLINACEIAGKNLSDIRVVCNGAGAAGIACMNLYADLGVKRSNIMMCDTKGVIFKGRKEGMNKYKEPFAVETEKRTLAEALKGADVFLGVSAKDCVTAEMVASMNENPVIFAMANPDPEITPEAVLNVRKDAIIATGRSDYPNQITNVLGFPFIFRGALDVRASKITEGMKMAAARALAALAKEPVPDVVKRAYGGKEFCFGYEYILPKPFDPRVIEWEALAVAKQACAEGVARKPVADWDTYRSQLKKRIEKMWTI